MRLFWDMATECRSGCGHTIWVTQTERPGEENMVFSPLNYPTAALRPCHSLMSNKSAAGRRIRHPCPSQHHSSLRSGPVPRHVPCPVGDGVGWQVGQTVQVNLDTYVLRTPTTQPAGSGSDPRDQQQPTCPCPVTNRRRKPPAKTINMGRRMGRVW